MCEKELQCERETVKYTYTIYLKCEDGQNVLTSLNVSWFIILVRTHTHTISILLHLDSVLFHCVFGHMFSVMVVKPVAEVIVTIPIRYTCIKHMSPPVIRHSLGAQNSQSLHHFH